jgi:hypothetical protein
MEDEMKVYEFPAKIGPKGKLALPEDLVKSLTSEETVRVIIVVNEASETEEDADWSRFATDQLLAQYDDADAIYDNL